MGITIEDILKYGVILVAIWIGYCVIVKKPGNCKKNCNKTPPPSVQSVMEGFMGKNYFKELSDDADETLKKPVLDDSTSKKCPGNFVASALLPKGDPKMKEWADLAPKGPLQGVDLLLEPNKTIGYDTVGNHLRNASYDLRKEIPNPVVQVSPWSNTTMGPDLSRRPLEDCGAWTVNQK